MDSIGTTFHPLIQHERNFSKSLTNRKVNFSIGIFSCPMHPIQLVGLYTTRRPVFRWKVRGYDWILVDSIGQPSSSVDHITINDKQIEVSSSAKLLGVVVSDNLRWNAHVESICKKAATRLYFLKQLKRAKVPPKDMLLFYTTCIRPVLEYACPVFHHSLPQYLSNEMERLQKRALRIIQRDLC